MKRSYIREILDNIKEDTISFAGGLPNEDLFALEEIKKACNIVLNDKKSLQYSSSRGILSLREEIACMYTKMYNFKTSSDEILITTGSQQSFDLLAKTFLKDEVCLEEHSYLGAISAFKIMKLKIKEFKKINELKDLLNKNKALYCMSDFSNPSTKTYNKKQREKLLSVLNKKKCFLIEDAAYSLLSFSSKIHKPLSSSYKKSFHLGSFSKIVAPGLRIGFIRAKKEYIDELLIAKESADLHTSTFTQMILFEYLKKNDLTLHLNIIRKDYKSKMKFMSKCFKKYIPSFSFVKPKGGMFIFGSFKEDSMNLATKALKYKLAFVPAYVFSSKNKRSNYARFNFSNASYSEIEKGIKILKKILKKG